MSDLQPTRENKGRRNKARGGEPWPTGATYILAVNAGTTGIVGTTGNLTAEEKARYLDLRVGDSDQNDSIENDYHRFKK